MDKLQIFLLMYFLHLNSMNDFVQIPFPIIYLPEIQESTLLMHQSLTIQTANSSKIYAEALYQAQHAIKQVRDQPRSIELHEHIDSLVQHMKIIVKYMSQQQNHQRSTYQRAVVLLDNILVLDHNMLIYLQISQLFISNLHKYFHKIVILSQQQAQTPSQQYKIHNKIYSCLYLILLLVHKSNSNSILKKQLNKRLFVQQFIKKFIQINYQKLESKIIRVIVIILVYIIKNKRFNKSVHKDIKDMILGLILESQEEVTNVYLMVGLRYMIKQITLSQIHKFKLIQFIFEGLNSTQPQTVKNSLISIQQLLSHHKFLTTKLINLKLMKHFDKNINQYPSICLNILKHILPYTQQQKIQSWFNTYFNYIRANHNNISHVHLRILLDLSKYISMNLWICIIEAGYIWKIEEIQYKNDNNLRKALSQLMKQFKNKFREFDPNLLAIYENLKSGERAKIVRDFY